ncbi:hypothetical protein [Nannocystis bainbridge]|uniref:Uncharacterized protein n=1 Tax=Nannocystis bainbridge TaxID=2995303 RepID=A0ABT5DP68_9BACT|nr:hypothetical protein [Nannocystis bainbridge]MDC0715455.1 hypothetical protein [Nannocystis bainbridge]
MHLTALACAVAVVTDGFDDGASAEAAHDVRFDDRYDLDGDLNTAGRTGPSSLDEVLRAPVRALAPVTPAPVEPALDEPAQVAADRAQVEQFLPHQCVHGVDEQRPRLTRNEQKRTYDVLAHVVKRLKASDDFLKLLQLVASRESSLQQGLVHRLSPDLEASQQAWRKTAKLYEGNPHHAEHEHWQTYGLFGMNSNYFTQVWDNQADPRVLCDAIVDILVYRRAVARVIRKAGTAIECTDAAGRTYQHTTRATWESVHRAVSGGKMCPSKSENVAAIMGKYFRGRAAKFGLDPDKPVTLKMLGVEPAKGLDGAAWADQEAIVMGLWAELEAEWAEHPPDEPEPVKIARTGV